jgi:hypothetical protein
MGSAMSSASHTSTSRPSATVSTSTGTLSPAPSPFPPSARSTARTPNSRRRTASRRFSSTTTRRAIRQSHASHLCGDPIPCASAASSDATIRGYAAHAFKHTVASAASGSAIRPFVITAATFPATATCIATNRPCNACTSFTQEALVPCFGSSMSASSAAHPNLRYSPL